MGILVPEKAILLGLTIVGIPLLLGGYAGYCRGKCGVVPGICGVLILAGFFVYAFILVR